MAYLLGIDVSTTGAKALLIDERGAVAAQATTEYPLSTPRPLWSEQSPADWWRGVCASIRAALAKASIKGADISGVGLTGQMHGLVMMDKSGQVLRPAILWNDQRTGPQCAEIMAKVGGLNRLRELTGNAVLPGFTAPKILWVRENEPAMYDKTAHILLPKDYARHCLTGEYATEVSDASGTSLLDVAQRRWSGAMLQALDLPSDWLPRCTESPEISGRVSAAAGRETGLLTGTPVVGGGGDQAAQAVGSGVVTSGVISVTSGTSGVVFAHADGFAAESRGRLHSFCHAVPGKWHLMGVMLSAGGSFRWLHDCLELIRGLGLQIEQVRASGGGARSALWRQIQADVFGSELVLVNVTEGAAYGAALLAGVGAGIYASVEEAVAQTVKITDRTVPIPAHVRQYEALYPVYRSLYPALAPCFQALSSIS